MAAGDFFCFNVLLAGRNSDLPENDAALEWVFHVAGGQREGLDLSALPEETSLQRKMKALLLAGRKPGAAYGVLARPFR